MFVYFPAKQILFIYFFIFIFWMGYADMKTRPHINNYEVNETNARAIFIQIMWYFYLLNALIIKTFSPYLNYIHKTLKQFSVQDVCLTLNGNFVSTFNFFFSLYIWGNNSSIQTIQVFYFSYLYQNPTNLSRTFM